MRSFKNWDNFGNSHVCAKHVESLVSEDFFKIKLEQVHSRIHMICCRAITNKPHCNQWTCMEEDSNK